MKFKLRNITATKQCINMYTHVFFIKKMTSLFEILLHLLLFKIESDFFFQNYENTTFLGRIQKMFAFFQESIAGYLNLM